MKAVVIGASTGGPNALTTVLEGLGESFDAVVIIIQHLPGNVTKTMTSRLDKVLPVSVVEMEHGEELISGNVYVVPGDYHFFIIKPGKKVHLFPTNDTLSPSINMGLTSVAEHFGKDTIAIILSGIGEDGTLGAKAIQQFGGKVIAQDESTSAVYGMPKSVKEEGYADEVLPLDKISSRVLELL